MRRGPARPGRARRRSCRPPCFQAAALNPSARRQAAGSCCRPALRSRRAAWRPWRRGPVPRLNNVTPESAERSSVRSDCSDAQSTLRAAADDLKALALGEAHLTASSTCFSFWGLTASAMLKFGLDHGRQRCSIPITTISQCAHRRSASVFRKEPAVDQPPSQPRPRRTAHSGIQKDEPARGGAGARARRQHHRRVQRDLHVSGRPSRTRR